MEEDSVTDMETGLSYCVHCDYVTTNKAALWEHVKHHRFDNLNPTKVEKAVDEAWEKYKP